MTDSLAPADDDEDEMDAGERGGFVGAFATEVRGERVDGPALQAIDWRVEAVSAENDLLTADLSPGA